MGTASSGEWIAILLYFALVIGVGVYFFIRLKCYHLQKGIKNSRLKRPP